MVLCNKVYEFIIKLLKKNLVLWKIYTYKRYFNIN